MERVILRLESEMWDIFKNVCKGFNTDELILLCSPKRIRKHSMLDHVQNIDLPPRRSTYDIFNEPVKLMRVECTPSLQYRLDWQDKFEEFELQDVFEHHDECDCERCNVNFDRSE